MSSSSLDPERISPEALLDYLDSKMSAVQNKQMELKSEQQTPDVIRAQKEIKLALANYIDLSIAL